MSAKPKLMEDGRTVTVRVPISIRRHGGRKLVLAPDGTGFTEAFVRRHVDSAMVKALARAFRWREMLESEEHDTIKQLAAVEKINQSYVARILRLTLLAPDIIESIMDGKQPASLTLPSLMRQFGPFWTTQRQKFDFVS